MNLSRVHPSPDLIIEISTQPTHAVFPTGFFEGIQIVHAVKSFDFFTDRLENLL